MQNNFVENQWHHLYISPLTACNLNCQLCYTAKNAETLRIKEILDFLDRYQRVVEIQTVTYCGGELLAWPDWVDLVNSSQELGIFVQVITNGTVGMERLSEVKKPEECNLIVSIDGLEADHDLNRGQGNWRRSVDFLKKAREMGFPVEIFTVVTRRNYLKLDEFELVLGGELGLDDEELTITYHPRKPIAYLINHPLDNYHQESGGFDWLLPHELRELSTTKRIFPPPQQGCWQVALMSDGLIYGCCEGGWPLAKMTDDIEIILQKMREKINKMERNCIYPGFRCGLKMENDEKRRKLIIGE